MKFNNTSKNDKIKAKINDEKVCKKSISTNAVIGCKFDAMHFHEVIHELQYYQEIPKMPKVYDSVQKHFRSEYQILAALVNTSETDSWSRWLKYINLKHFQLTVISFIKLFSLIC